MRPSLWQILLIVVVLLVLFGWRRLPDMARSVGQSLRIFKSEVEQMTDKDKDKDDEPTPPQQPGGTTHDGTPGSVTHEQQPDGTRRTDGPGQGV